MSFNNAWCGQLESGLWRTVFSGRREILTIFRFTDENVSGDGNEGQSIQGNHSEHEHQKPPSLTCKVTEHPSARKRGRKKQNDQCHSKLGYTDQLFFLIFRLTSSFIT